MVLDQLLSRAGHCDREPDGQAVKTIVDGHNMAALSSRRCVYWLSRESRIGRMKNLFRLGKHGRVAIVLHGFCYFGGSNEAHGMTFIKT
jgi:hypothetical protein